MFASLNMIGLVAGAIAWFVIVVYVASDFGCTFTAACGAEDLVAFGLCSVGFLMPAWIVALVVSDASRGS
jgi:hypothetical protein